MAPRKVMKTRNQAAFWLIGCPTPKICGENRLPTLRNVLQHVLFHHNPPSVSIREACGLTADALLPFWVKGGIGTITHKCVVDRLVRVHQEWIELKRSMKRPTNKTREMFIASLDVLFDIASGALIKLEEDRQHYESMKEDRKAYMKCVDQKMKKTELKKLKRLQGQARLKRRSDEEKKALRLTFSADDVPVPVASEAEAETAVPVKSETDDDKGK